MIRQYTVDMTLVLGRCTQIAAHIIEAGASGYDRFAIEIIQGEPVSSLVVLDPAALSQLLEEDAPEERIAEVISDGSLLWYDEPRLQTRLRLWVVAFRSTWRATRREIIQRWHDAGVMLGKGRYKIRETENASGQGIPRVRIRAVLRDPLDAEDPSIVQNVLIDLIKRGRKRPVRSHSRMEERQFSPRRKPQIVMVDLFHTDGHLRWLTSGGWLGGNLVAIAERTWRGRDPVHVKNPQVTVKKVGMRFEIDADRWSPKFGQYAKVAPALIIKGQEQWQNDAVFLQNSRHESHWKLFLRIGSSISA